MIFSVIRVALLLVLTALSSSAMALGSAPRGHASAVVVWSPETAQSRPSGRYASTHWRRGVPTIAVARSNSDLVNEALRYEGSGNFTGLREAWCADAVNIWLRATGRPPLAGRMAGDALRYGPRGLGAPGELVVMATRHGYAGHVGIVVATHGNNVEIISGNWGHRVSRAIIPRYLVTAFIQT